MKKNNLIKLIRIWGILFLAGSGVYLDDFDVRRIKQQNKNENSSICPDRCGNLLTFSGV